MTGRIDVNSYVARHMYKVRGYLKLLDAQIIAALGHAQIRDGVRGDLVEIGVHHGKLFIILALLRQQGERLLAADLFEDDELNRATVHAGRENAFFRNLKKLGVAVSTEEIYKGDSLKLTPEQLQQRVAQVRLFSIDGGHYYEHVSNDVRLAAQVIHDKGVIIVDDFFTTRWPEVTFATYDFLRKAGEEMRPFLVSKSKLYICREAAIPYYLDLVRTDPILAGYPREDVRMLNANLVYMRQAMRQAVLDELRDRLGMMSNVG
jgi:hypothetical protein